MKFSKNISEYEAKILKPTQTINSFMNRSKVTTKETNK